jgi:Saxitoxin biosynthesis operon protein SxtJ
MGAGWRAIGVRRALPMMTSAKLNFPERLERGDSFQSTSDRMFGLVFAVFWSVVALAPLRKGDPIRVWAMILAAAFLVPALVRPTILGLLNQQWLRFGRLLQKLTNPIVMAFLFFFTITPAGFIIRLLNRDALRLGWDRESATYWISRTPAGLPPESMKDQF